MDIPLSLIGSYIGPALSLAQAGTSQNPGQAIGEKATELALKEGLKYLNQQTGASDWLMNQLGGAYDWIGSLFPGAAAAPSVGAAGGAVGPELAGAAFEGGLGAAGSAGTSALGPTISGISGGLAEGGAIPVAAWSVILSQILQDELNDPGGRVSSAQNEADQSRQAMPGLIGSLALGHRAFPEISDQLTDNQSLGLYQLLRGGVKANELMADPMKMQGQNEAGIKQPNFGGNVANLRTQGGPESVLGTMRAQDLLSQRGLQAPTFETATPLQREMAGLNYQSQNQAGASGEYTNPHMGMASPFDAQGNLAGLAPLRPHEALAKSGFNQPNLLAPENAPQMMAAYGVTADNPMPDALKKAFDWLGSGNQKENALYTPDVMEQLYKIQPGGLEQGIKGILAGAPTGEGQRLLNLAGPTSPSFVARAGNAPAMAPEAPSIPSLLDPLGWMNDRDRAFADVGGG